MNKVRPVVWFLGVYIFTLFRWHFTQEISRHYVLSLGWQNVCFSKQRSQSQQNTRRFHSLIMASLCCVEIFLPWIWSSHFLSLSVLSIPITIHSETMCSFMTHHFQLGGSCLWSLRWPFAHCQHHYRAPSSGESAHIIDALSNKSRSLSGEKEA